MLINLSDVMSDQHRTVEETVECTLDEIRMKSGSYPVVRKEPVHVRVEFVKGKELMILHRHGTFCCDSLRQVPGGSQA